MSKKGVAWHGMLDTAGRGLKGVLACVVFSPR